MNRHAKLKGKKLFVDFPVSLTGSVRLGLRLKLEMKLAGIYLTVCYQRNKLQLLMDIGEYRYIGVNHPEA